MLPFLCLICCKKPHLFFSEDWFFAQVAFPLWQTVFFLYLSGNCFLIAYVVYSCSFMIISFFPQLICILYVSPHSSKIVSLRYISPIQWFWLLCHQQKHACRLTFPMSIVQAVLVVWVCVLLSSWNVYIPVVDTIDVQIFHCALLFWGIQFGISVLVLLHSFPALCQSILRRALHLLGFHGILPGYCNFSAPQFLYISDGANSHSVLILCIWSCPKGVPFHIV